MVNERNIPIELASHIIDVCTQEQQFRLQLSELDGIHLHLDIVQVVQDKMDTSCDSVYLGVSRARHFGRRCGNRCDQTFVGRTAHSDGSDIGQLVHHSERERAILHLSIGQTLVTSQQSGKGLIRCGRICTRRRTVLVEPVETAGQCRRYRNNI